MTGIYLLSTLGIWLAFCIWLSKAIAQKMPKAVLRIPIGVAVFVLLLLLPLLDEFIGSRQFEQLCKANSTIQVDRAAAAGKTVYLADMVDIEIKNKWLRFVVRQWRFLDATTNELVVSYNTLMAGGGRLSQMLGISEGRVPLTFKGQCEPGGLVDPVKLFSDLKITQIQRSKLNHQEKK